MMGRPPISSLFPYTTLFRTHRVYPCGAGPVVTREYDANAPELGRRRAGESENDARDLAGGHGDVPVTASRHRTVGGEIRQFHAPVAGLKAREHEARGEVNAATARAIQEHDVAVEVELPAGGHG